MNRKRLVQLVAMVLAVLVVVAGAAAGTRTTPSGPAMVAVAFNKHLKTNIVVDGKGRALYMYTGDTGGKGTCLQEDPQCGKLWPPLTTVGKPHAGKGIIASLLATARYAGGVQQVTYNHHPLYYFHGLTVGSGDLKPGDIKGQSFFSVWFVLSPKGIPIKRQ
jgi:predicted lipoprotein with Yx(FWY)xxD motif